MVEWIRQITAFGPRRPGSPADLAVEDYLVNQLKNFGLENIRKEPISIGYWESKDAQLQFDDGRGYKPLAAHYIPYTNFTPLEGVTAPMVYADTKKLFSGANWKGKIVVTDIEFPDLNIKLLDKLSLGRFDPDGTLLEVDHPATWVRLNWHFYNKAVRSGALGFVGILKDQPGGSYRMYAPYGFKEKDILNKPIPGFWVGRDNGPLLRHLARSGQGRIRMVLTGTLRPGVTHNVVGEILGELDERIVLSCHHDSPFISPVEDASGCSVVLALAKHLAQSEKPKRTLTILFSAGHFYGSIGTRTFLKEHASDLIKKVAMEISIEHIANEAVEDKTGQLVQSGRPEASGVFVPFNRKVINLVMKALRSGGVDRTVLLPSEGPLGDYPPTDGGDWYAAGIPLINYICNPVYLLNAEDDYCWVAEERLPKVAQAFAQIIQALDGLTKKEMARSDFHVYKLCMQMLKHVVRAKTTWLGTRPVY